MGGKLEPVYKSPFYDFYKKDKIMTFEQWLAQVDKLIASRLEGLTSSDLPDRCYRDAYDDEVSPEDYVQEFLGDGDDYDLMYQAVFG